MTSALLRSASLGGPPNCSPETYAKIARILHDRTGISLPQNNGSLLVSRLAKHLRKLQLADFESYLNWISQPENAEDLKIMISSLTTNTTRFFREPYHFDIFARELLPNLQTRARSGERIRLWSAGCSSGEEPFSLAATILHHWPDVAKYDVRILATDICSPALAHAQAGSYPRDKLDGVPPPIRDLMLGDTPNDCKTVTMPRVLQDLISVKYLNFIDYWPARGPFQAIFCRNVAIYMEDKVQLTVWSRLIDLLDSGGFLFIGHSERLPASQSGRVKLIDRTTFRMP